MHKLKRVNFVLKELNKHGFSQVQVVDLQAQKKMAEAHKQMHLHPGNIEIA